MAPSRILDDESLDLVTYGTDKTANFEKVKSKARPWKNGSGLAMPQAWEGSELQESQYVITLTDEERLEAERAAECFIASEQRINFVTPASFLLPTLGPRLVEAKSRLTHGLGFFILRGLTPDKYDNETNIVLYVGLSSYISTKRAIQYPGGPALTHVVDLSSDEDREEHRGKWIGSGNQNLSLPFHTDNGHTLCLYSIHSVPVGGRSRLASSRKVVDTLRQEQPHLIKTLLQDWEWDTFSNAPAGSERPLLYEQDSRAILNYSRRPLIGLPDFPRRAGLKPLTDLQGEALDTLERLANRFALTFKFKTGDIQYVNNLALLHGREAFLCQRPAGCRRHLLRMFLKDEEDRLVLPGKLDTVMQGLYAHDVEEEKFPWSLAPLPYVLSP